MSGKAFAAMDSKYYEAILSSGINISVAIPPAISSKMFFLYILKIGKN